MGCNSSLVSLALAQRMAEAMVPPELHELQAQLSRVADGLAGALEELPEIARGDRLRLLHDADQRAGQDAAGGPLTGRRQQPWSTLMPRRRILDLPAPAPRSRHFPTWRPPRWQV